LAGVSQAQENFQGLESIGKPEPKGMGFQFPATELMRDLVWLDNFLLVIITVISVFVTCLLAYAAFKFHRSRNDTPGTFTHHSVLEVAWTVVPVGILVVIGAFSLPILFKQQEIPEADITIKVTGYQWYWGYEYVDHDFGFDSVMLQKDELADYGYAPDEYLLATDTAVVVPVGATVVMQLTGADVIHSWTSPAFGVKQDAVPGRLAELWFAAEKEGVYFGQCSELCGQAHAYMPITVKVVSQEQYDAWLSSTIEELAGVPQSVQVASN
jgi:cytochrome c oxidase subunit 2